MSEDPAVIEDRALRWGHRPENSARAVLVTLLGDTIAPLGGSVWLSDLFTLAEPFGFNERLVRTSMFRLVSERWVTNRRVGRRSQYQLTPFAREEFTSADARIYRRREPDWDGQWTLVFLIRGDDGDDELAQHLRWRGFVEMTGGVFAAPDREVASVRQLCRRLEVAPPPPIATARFDEIGAPTRAGPFRDASGLTEAEAGYRDFVDRYRWTESIAFDQLTPKDAFLVRTMLIHDLRRARLRDPDLPAALLPRDWVGAEAIEVAGRAYRALFDASWRWVESVTGLAVDAADPAVSRRFAPAA